MCTNFMADQNQASVWESAVILTISFTCIEDNELKPHLATERQATKHHAE